MVFATCHSGIGKSKLPPPIEKLVSENKGKIVSFDEVSEGSLILAAATKENPPGKIVASEDIYTHFLLEALETYDRNQDGMISALEAHDYAKDKTWTYTRGKQRPTAEVRFIGDADIPLNGKRKRQGLPILEAYDESLADFSIQVGGNRKGTLPSAFPLENGRNQIRIYDPLGDLVAQYEVKLKPGEVIDIQTLLQPPPFGLSIDRSTLNWHNSNFKKLTGDSSSLEYRLSAYYNFRNLRLGLYNVFPRKVPISTLLI